MIPFIVIGVAAAALLISGCSEEKPPSPEKLPEPAPSPSPPPAAELKPPSEAPGPKGTEEEAPAGPKKPLSPEEFKELVEGLRHCLQIQKKYKFDCPPPEELPPNCKCSEIRLDKRFDPNTPIRFKNKLIPAPPEPKGLPQS